MRRAIVLIRILISIVIAVAVLASCRRAGDVLARLVERGGVVEADLARVPEWRDAKVGTEFRSGQAVRTGARSHTTLRLSDDSLVDLKENTLLRFLDRPPGANAAQLELAMGEAEIQAGPKALRVETRFGAVVISEHARLQLQRTGVGTRFAVLVGTARIEARDADKTLRPGESVEVNLGQAVVESPPSSDADTVPAAQTTELANPEPSDAGASSGAAGHSSTISGPEPTSAFRRGPEVLDLVIAAGESVTIHDPRPPTALGVRSASCTGDIVVELDRNTRDATTGRNVVHLSVPVGLHKYRATCADDDRTIASGVVVIMHDSGTRKLAKTAPLTRIDADGRRYTVLYQSRLPRIEVVWPAAPSGNYVLYARSSRGQKGYGTATPRHTFDSGELAEGAHEIWFEATGAAQSKITSLVIRFDNAAPTASIALPEEGTIRAGESTAVAGTALPGWTVSAAGQTLPIDDHGRFSGQASVPAGFRALAIQFVHPQRGIHYYLRRGAR